MQMRVKVFVMPGAYHPQIVGGNVVCFRQFIGFQRDQIFHVIAVYPQPLTIAGVQRVHMTPYSAVARGFHFHLCGQHLFFCTVLVEDGALPVDIRNVVCGMAGIGKIAGVEYCFDFHCLTSLSDGEKQVVPIRHNLFFSIIRWNCPAFLQEK